MNTVATIPKVSVIICAYNTAAYIAETLDSVLSQTYQDFEIIVINDGSPDNMEEVLLPYYDQIIYHKQANRGLSGARNAALKKAGGKYVTLLDSDDVWMPNYLETMVSLMETNPSVDLYYPNALLFGEHHFNGKIFQDIYPSTRPVTIEGMLKHECCPFGAVIFKRNILATVGLFDDTLKSAEDLDLWLRMLQHGYRLDFTEEVLIKYRKRTDSLSGSSSHFFDQVIKVLEKFQKSESSTFNQINLAAEFISRLEADRDLVKAKQEILAEDFGSAIKHIINIFAIRPSLKLKLIITGLLLSPKTVAWVMRWQESKSSIR